MAPPLGAGPSSVLCGALQQPPAPAKTGMLCACQELQDARSAPGRYTTSGLGAGQALYGAPDGSGEALLRAWPYLQLAPQASTPLIELLKPQLGREQARVGRVG